MEHLHHELADPRSQRIEVETAYGKVIGGRATNGSVVFLEIPYALPPRRFTDPQSLPQDFRYENREYVQESAYCAQPSNDGQAAGTPFEDKVGLGKSTENPLFLNIHLPPSFPSTKLFPVKIYIHGGFLQFGSPHGLSSQAQYIAAERNEVWINVGYRVSVLGFIGCDQPRLTGNYGFKDQWLALLWIKNNIHAFGGDPDNIQVTGLSAGAHSVHQLLFHTSQLPDGVPAPFHSAVLQSNGIVEAPRTLKELRPQFYTLCEALELDPQAPDILETLRNPEKVPIQTLMHVIETEALGLYGTFRGCVDGEWLVNDPDPMAWQRSGEFANRLREKGVRSIAIGHVSEEWYLYSIAHPVEDSKDIALNLCRYFKEDTVRKLTVLYRALSDRAGKEEVLRLFGDILSDGQVHLPVRLLHRDLLAAGFPVLRYMIKWAPEQLRKEGYVTHGADRVLWAFKAPWMDSDQLSVARAWLVRFSEEMERLEHAERSARTHSDILVLKEDTDIAWETDKDWESIMRLTEALEGEVEGR